LYLLVVVELVQPVQQFLQMSFQMYISLHKVLTTQVHQQLYLMEAVELVQQLQQFLVLVLMLEK
jgi:hypothetical protein